MISTPTPFVISLHPANQLSTLLISDTSDLIELDSVHFNPPASNGNQAFAYKKSL